MSLTPLFLKSLSSLEFNKITLLLEQCAITDDAKHKCLELLPSTNESEVNKTLLQTDDARVLLIKRGSPSFGGAKNIKAHIERANIGSSLSMKELLEVAAVLRVARNLVAYKAQETTNKTTLDIYFEGISPNKYLEERILSCILSEEEMADSASNELFDIRRKIKNNTAKIRDILNKIIHSQTQQKYLQDPIITMRGDRFVIPVKHEYKNEINGIVHDTSTSGATVFIEPMSVVEANNELRQLFTKEQQEMERILYLLSSEVSTFGEGLIYTYENICEIDFIFSKAKLAEKLKCSMPKMNTKGNIHLKKARHPLLQLKIAVPIDVVLGVDYDTLVITGPNTGGKTVSLKTVGLLTVMAQSGLHIPAYDNSELGIFQNVFADIGDEQSIEQSLSTFSSHMTNIVKIVDTVDSDTLVLFDELGAGTDPVEGASLAISILQYIRGFKAKIVATTHYPELKLFALETVGVENASCEFNVDTLKPTYRLITGIPGRSNAFAIAGRLGLNDHIISKAAELISNENRSFEHVIEKLEANRKLLETEKMKAENESQKAKILLEQTEKIKKELEEKIKKENERATKDAQIIVQNAKEQAENIINELLAFQKQKDKADFKDKLHEIKAKSKQVFNKLEDEINPVDTIKTNYKLPRKLKVGDSVNIISINKMGTVIIAPDSTGYLTVQAGIMKTRVMVNDIRLVDEKSIYKNYENVVNISSEKSHTPIKNELDIRGKTALDVENEIEQFIDNAVMAGLSIVSIIHGKGTGALRTAVHSMLKGNKSIKNFRLGRYGEGETGVTIIEL